MKLLEPVYRQLQLSRLECDKGVGGAKGMGVQPHPPYDLIVLTLSRRCRDRIPNDIANRKFTVNSCMWAHSQ